MQNTDSVKPSPIVPVHIEPISRRNHLTFIFSGVVLLVVSFVCFLLHFKILGFGLLLSGFLFVLLGYLKYLEPKVSLSLRKEGFVWYLKHSAVRIEWENIAHWQTLKANIGNSSRELSYIGIKLKDISSFIHSLSPRSAKQLYVEYRSLVHIAVVEASQHHTSTINIFDDNEPKKLPDGSSISGIKSSLVGRLQLLRHHIGADIFIPINSLDRDEQSFVMMAREYQQSVINDKINHDA